MAQRVAAKILERVMKDAARDALNEYSDKYNPTEAYWEVKTNSKGEVKKGQRKYWKKSRILHHEVYRPRGVTSEHDIETLAFFRKWAWRLDMCICPGTCGLTIGLGALFGLIPIIGDFTDFILGWVLIETVKRKIDRGDKGTQGEKKLLAAMDDIIWKMRGTVFLAFLIGFIPFFGDIFGAAYKANTRNVWILEHYMMKRADLAAVHKVELPQHDTIETDPEKGYIQPEEPQRSHQRGGF